MKEFIAWVTNICPILVLIGTGALAVSGLIIKHYLTYKLKIEVGEVKIEPVGTGIVVANITLRPSKKMQLSDIMLEYCDKKVKGSIRDNEQLLRFIDCNVSYDVEFQFFNIGNDAAAWELGEQMRVGHLQERREVNLRIRANGTWWPPSTLLIPTIIGSVDRKETNIEKAKLNGMLPSEY
ncbi:MAG: hypothetical protein ABSA18_12610 [Dehalococcoidia bacterium]